jgi:hypothetical protein
MTVNLSSRIDNYAIYLPALNQTQVEFVVGEPTPPYRVRPVDLNFLDGRSKLWTYKWCLGSAGHFAYTRKPDAITQRDPEWSWVMGDSGGYQVGTGTLKDLRGWQAHARDPLVIAQLWRRSLVTEPILRWLDLHCDCAMTVDIPLWVRMPKFKNSPFHHCGLEILTDLTIENLRYISNHRGVVGNCQFLNVLQGNDDDEEEYWYRRVREFDFEGWAIGGSVGAGLNLQRLLKRMLLLRDEGMLGGRKGRFHILGISQIKWAVVLTAIQRAVQKCTGSQFTVTFDTATPVLSAGRFQRHVKPPNLTRDLKSWKFTYAAFPVGLAAATKNADQPFPAGSPLSRLLTIGDMNPKTSPYAAQTFDQFGYVALANHNTYVLLRAFIDANKAVCHGRTVPQPIADMVGTIGQLFASERWSSLLKSSGALIAALGMRSI